MDSPSLEYPYREKVALARLTAMGRARLPEGGDCNRGKSSKKQDPGIKLVYTTTMTTTKFRECNQARDRETR